MDRLADSWRVTGGLSVSMWSEGSWSGRSWSGLSWSVLCVKLRVRYVHSAAGAVA